MSTFFLYGVPGSGKTTLACSLCKMGMKVELIDIDLKAEHMWNLQDFFKKGLIVHRPIRARLVEDPLRNRVMMASKTKGTAGSTIVKQPKGYYEFLSMITEHEKACAEGKKPEASALIIDSLTTAIEHYARLYLFLSKHEAISLPDYDIVRQHFEELFSALFILHPHYFQHIIVIGHERVDRDEDTGRITSILPQIMGSTREKVGKNFMEYYRCIVTKGKYIVQTRTKDRDHFQANTVMNLADEEEADLVAILERGTKGGARKNVEQDTQKPSAGPTPSGALSKPGSGATNT